MKINLEITDPLFDLSLWMHRHSFVIWRKPGEEKHQGFIATVDILPEGSFPDAEAFVFSPFVSGRAYPTLAFYPKDFKSKNDSTIADATFPVRFPEDIPDNAIDYCKRIELLTSVMQEGELHKCVLSRRIDLNDPEESLAPDLFLKLCDRYPDAFVSLVHIPNVFTWVGATPERLLKVKEQKGYTTAIAATRPFEGILPHFSEWNKKEQEEQQLVTDFILNVLENEKIQGINCIGPTSIQAGNLIHLKTDIYFPINSGTDVFSLIRALHPTPAVCGLPKEKALTMIASLEPHDREYYSGYMGFISKDELELFVNLRCMRWIGGKPSLFVGGGITAASIPQQEWEETNFKAQTLLDVIEKLCNLAGKNPDAH